MQRSININHYRVRYWLAVNRIFLFSQNGAAISPRVQRILSHFDIMPPPLIPHGRGNLYPTDKTIKFKNIMHLNPVKSKLAKIYEKKILE